MKKVLYCTRQMAVLIMVVVIAGCAADTPPGPASKDTPPARMEALYTQTPIKVDGKLDENVWKKAKVYDLTLSADKLKNGKKINEAGNIRLAWDEKYFYLAASFMDSDIVAEGKADQMHHYKFGDLCELFLKPEKNTWYWELYVTPHSKKSAFWFPGRGRLGLPSSFENFKMQGLKVAAQCTGTLNNWKDIDRLWTAEMAVPVAQLTAHGDAFGPGTNWRILVARYNYSRYLYDKELSMTPKLSQTNYHLLNEYAALGFIK